MVFANNLASAIRYFFTKNDSHILPPAVAYLLEPGNTKGGSITVLLTSGSIGLESAARLLTIFVFICKTG
jgi:hypothetical protein